ncbi:MAG: flagellar biosynthetic protein FliQ [Bdellovibrionales bacterium]|nr:flagellar biosynthetic protein FliQ [Bdellovibrionales bacterium]
MNIETVIEDGLLFVLLLSGIPLAASMVTGLCSSVLQAATQIQDQTLSFVPKVAAVAAALYFGADAFWVDFIRFAKDIFRFAPMG